jgi:hypothetical protein
MRGISGLAEDLLVSQEGLCSMELVSGGEGFFRNSLTYLSKLHVTSQTTLILKYMCLNIPIFHPITENFS